MLLGWRWAHRKSRCRASLLLPLPHPRQPPASSSLPGQRSSPLSAVVHPDKVTEKKVENNPENPSLHTTRSLKASQTSPHNHTVRIHRPHLTRARAGPRDRIASLRLTRRSQFSTRHQTPAQPQTFRHTYVGTFLCPFPDPALRAQPRAHSTSIPRQDVASA